MKRLFKGIAAAGLSLMMLAGNTMRMFADEIIPPQTPQKTTEGVSIVTTELDNPGSPNRKFDVLITIPEGFDGNVIKVYPLENIPTVHAQPSDKRDVHVKIVE